MFHQAVLSSDGKTTFAAFVYDNATISAAQSFQGNILAGFDAGDQIRSATIHRPGFTSLQNVNVFRIDGKSLVKVL